MSRRTVDMIFAALQLQEKFQEVRIHLYTTSVGQTKTFDAVIYDGLWEIMLQYRCTERFALMVCQLHDDMMARVTDNRTVSESFKETTDAKQGCLLPPTFSNLMLAVVLLGAYRGGRQGINVAYRVDDQLLITPRMQTSTSTSTATAHGLPSAKDCAPSATTEAAMQINMEIQSQTGCRLATCLCLEPGQTPTQHEAQNAQGGSPSSSNIRVACRVVRHYAHTGRVKTVALTDGITACIIQAALGPRESATVAIHECGDGDCGDGDGGGGGGVSGCTGTDDGGAEGYGGTGGDGGGCTFGGV
ncbi:hypothetical protein SprV_0802603900 [Sparganum proliferum]